MSIPFAHSVAGAPTTIWEPLQVHGGAVARRAGAYAASFGCMEIGRLAGVLHDIGKNSAAFQAYLHDGGAQGPDHSTAGAVEALRAYPGQIGRIMASIIAGHHTGLADGADLARRLGKTLEPYAGWQHDIGTLT